MQASKQERSRRNPTEIGKKIIRYHLVDLFNMVYPTSHTQTGLWLRLMFTNVTYIGAWTRLDTQNVDSKINCGYCLHMGEGSALQ